MMRRTWGFTLIELLVVMSIIALLLSIALPRYFNGLDHAREQVLKENLRLLRISIDRYQADQGHYPNALNDLVTAKYLKAIPLDPVTESADWKPTEGSEPGQEGIIDVHAGASGTTRDGTAYAAL